MKVISANGPLDSPVPTKIGKSACRTELRVQPLASERSLCKSFALKGTGPNSQRCMPMYCELITLIN
jgi:hypothetical protein